MFKSGKFYLSLAVAALLTAVLVFTSLGPRLIGAVRPLAERVGLADSPNRLDVDELYGSDGAWKGPRVALIGVDGLDFDLAGRLMEQGRLPNLSNMVKEGVSGKVLTWE